jgi:hypothetical protein
MLVDHLNDFGRPLDLGPRGVPAASGPGRARRRVGLEATLHSKRRASITAKRRPRPSKSGLRLRRQRQGTAWLPCARAAPPDQGIESEKVGGAAGAGGRPRAHDRPGGRPNRVASVVCLAERSQIPTRRRAGTPPPGSSPPVDRRLASVARVGGAAQCHSLVALIHTASPHGADDDHIRPLLRSGHGRPGLRTVRLLPIPAAGAQRARIGLHDVPEISRGPCVSEVPARAGQRVPGLRAPGEGVGLVVVSAARRASSSLGLAL